jgi:hypothetical protein
MIAITEEDGYWEVKYYHFETNKDSLLFLLNFLPQYIRDFYKI